MRMAVRAVGGIGDILRETSPRSPMPFTLILIVMLLMRMLTVVVMVVMMISSCRSAQRFPSNPSHSSHLKFKSSKGCVELERPTICYIFDRQFEDIKYDTLKGDVAGGYMRVISRPIMSYMFQKQVLQGYQIWLKQNRKSESQKVWKSESQKVRKSDVRYSEGYGCLLHLWCCFY